MAAPDEAQLRLLEWVTQQGWEELYDPDRIYSELMGQGLVAHVRPHYGDIAFYQGDTSGYTPRKVNLRNGVLSGLIGMPAEINWIWGAGQFEYNENPQARTLKIDPTGEQSKSPGELVYLIPGNIDQVYESFSQL